MAKGTNQKMKLLYLMRLLQERSDAEHPLTLAQIQEALDRLGVTAERKSLYDDFEALRTFGIDVERDARGYFVADRLFELPELKLLVDAVQASKFITSKKSDALIRKVESLCSTYEAGLLQRQVYVQGRVKAANESVYYNVDMLHTAISTGRGISFYYFEWALDFCAPQPLTRRYRHGGARYEASPWALMWEDENYYLVAFDVQADKIKHYRVDKMEDIRLEGYGRDGQEAFARFDMAQYARGMFGMFGGQEQTVQLEFAERLIGVVADRFGAQVFLSPGDVPGRFRATVRVAVSPLFLSWMASFGDEARILSPAGVAAGLRALAEQVLGVYEEG